VPVGLVRYERGGDGVGVCNLLRAYSLSQDERIDVERGSIPDPDGREVLPVRKGQVYEQDKGTLSVPGEVVGYD
jgi:hypothetical protein